MCCEIICGVQKDSMINLSLSYIDDNLKGKVAALRHTVPSLAD